MGKPFEFVAVAEVFDGVVFGIKRVMHGDGIVVCADYKGEELLQKGKKYKVTIEEVTE